MNKLRNFLANMDDYAGFHYSADSIRNGNPTCNSIIFEVAVLWTTPLIYILSGVVGGKFHKPNCDCDDMKLLRRLNELKKNG